MPSSLGDKNEDSEVAPVVGSTTTPPPPPPPPPPTQEEEDDGGQRQRQRPPSAIDAASFLSRAFWTWPYETLQRVGQLGASFDDSYLPELSTADRHSSVKHALEKLWRDEQERSSSPSLRAAFLKQFFGQTKVIQLVLYLESAAHILQALALGDLISHFSDANSPTWKGYLYASYVVGLSAYVMF